MKHHNLLKQSISLTLVALILAACNLLQPQGPKPGLWISSEISSDLSYIGFGVSDDSTTIDSFSMITVSLPCGDAIRIGQIQLIADETNSEVSNVMPSMVKGEIAPIDAGSFRIEFEMLILPFGNIYDLQRGQLIIEGSFTSSSTASGTWEVELLSSEGSCNGTWNAVPYESDSE